VKLSTDGLTLAPDAAIDLQLHTTYSDGTWTPEGLIDHLIAEGFGLAAITDHDRTDHIAALQELAITKGLPLLVATEISTTWRGEMTDVLCFGFDPENSAMSAVADDVLRRTQENTREVFDNLVRQSVIPDSDDMQAALKKVLNTPCVGQGHALVALVKEHGTFPAELTPGKMVLGAGFDTMLTEIGAAVEAAHRSGGVCLIAHPGRGDGYTCFDADLLDQLRAETPIDGFEAYYPRHTLSQIAMYANYARKHHLLTSAGSDSHGPDKPPIKYRAELSRALLERVGVRIG
jgi:3',5'-nucleoside bisphosphate phosphatase